MLKLSVNRAHWCAKSSANATF